MGRPRHTRRHELRQRQRAGEHAADAFLLCVWRLSRREANSAGFYRRGLDVRTWPQIYPLGFLPEIQPTVVDASGAAGLRGAWSQWTWDVSGEYGYNSFAFTIGNSLNVSLGPTIPPNKTEFGAGTLALGQVVANADISRSFRFDALSGPLNVAFGTEVRREAYQITAGEPDSYRGGDVPNRTGGVAAIGAQVFPGFRPGNEVDESRSSTFEPKWLTDAEVSFRVSEQLTFAAGGQNLFNAFPDRNIVQNSFFGIQTFPSHSPFGMNGRTIYGRLMFKI